MLNKLLVMRVVVGGMVSGGRCMGGRGRDCRRLGRRGRRGSCLGRGRSCRSRRRRHHLLLLLLVLLLNELVDGGGRSGPLGSPPLPLLGRQDVRVDRVRNPFAGVAVGAIVPPVLPDGVGGEVAGAARMVRVHFQVFVVDVVLESGLGHALGLAFRERAGVLAAEIVHASQVDVERVGVAALVLAQMTKVLLDLQVYAVNVELNGTFGQPFDVTSLVGTGEHGSSLAVDGAHVGDERLFEGRFVVAVFAGVLLALQVHAVHVVLHGLVRGAHRLTAVVNARELVGSAATAARGAADVHGCWSFGWGKFREKAAAKR